MKKTFVCFLTKSGVITICSNLRLRPPAFSCLGHAKPTRCVRSMSVPSDFSYISGSVAERVRILVREVQPSVDAVK